MDADTGRAHGVARLIRPLALYEAVDGGVQRLVAHGGGTPLAASSDEAKLLLLWIEAGAQDN